MYLCWIPSFKYRNCLKPLDVPNDVLLTVHTSLCHFLAHHPTGQLAMMYPIHLSRYGLSALYTFKQAIMHARYSIIAMFSLQLYELFAVYVFLLFYFSLRTTHSNIAVNYRMHEEMRLVGVQVVISPTFASLIIIRRLLRYIELPGQISKFSISSVDITLSLCGSW